VSTQDRPRVVVTHWVHPEVAGYLATFCEPVLPARPGQVFAPETVADLAAGADGLIIGVMRRVAEADREMRQGTFAGWRPRLYGAGLDEATTGIVGMGQVGRAVARRLSGFGTRIVYCDRRPIPPGELPTGAEATRLDWFSLRAVSDVMVLALPLTGETRHLLGAEALAAMRPGAFLVNVGRGLVVDEDAVAGALASGQLGGYAADVFAMEDWARPDRPRRIPPRLLAHPRTLFTPHLGSAVDAVRRRMSLEAARQVEQVLRGQRPDHAVNDPAFPGRGGPGPGPRRRRPAGATGGRC
jgi:phosphonate dehydrogenase